MEIERQIILNALEKVMPGLATSEDIAQSSSFIFMNGNVFAYNDEIAVSYKIDLDIEGAIPSNELFSLLKKIKGNYFDDNDMIDIKTTKNELLISTKRSKSGILLEKEILLPTDLLNDDYFDDDDFYSLPDKFLSGIKIALTCVAKESDSIILSNVHMKNKYIESCDNIRMVRYDLGEDSQEDFLIPATACQHLLKYKVTEYAKKEGWLHFSDGEGFMFSCRTIEDEYPDLSPFLKVKGDDLKLPGELVEMMDRANIFNNFVDVHIEKNWLKVRAEGESGWTEEKTRIKEKKEIFFCINPQLLKEIMRTSNKTIVGPKSLKFELEDFVHVLALIAN